MNHIQPMKNQPQHTQDREVRKQPRHPRTEYIRATKPHTRAAHKYLAVRNALHNTITY